MTTKQYKGDTPRQIFRRVALSFGLLMLHVGTFLFRVVVAYFLHPHKRKIQRDSGCRSRTWQPRAFHGTDDYVDEWSDGLEHDHRRVNGIR